MNSHLGGREIPSVHIPHTLRNGANGGGNQFLYALRGELIERGVYSHNLESSDVLLLNSFDISSRGLMRDVVQAKARNPSMTVVHRVDGPFSLVRGFNDASDLALNRLNELIADATIFQTSWSQSMSLMHGLTVPNMWIRIVNAPNPLIFFDNKRHTIRKEKVKLVASSWSSNENKGFDVYRWLDRNLDWRHFEMDFFGNSPSAFRNIRCHGALNSEDLGDSLRLADIYISAARNEPCSNALLEALHCGLPAIGFDGGGTPEIIGGAGELFRYADEIPQLLERIVENYPKYKSAINLPSLSEVTNLYLEFMGRAHDLPRKKKISRLDGMLFELEFESSLFRVRRKIAQHYRRGK